MDQTLAMHKNIFYRHYNLPAHFPVIGLLGDSWLFESAPVTRMHFHNCLEIGFLYEGSGVYCIDDGTARFKAPCIVLAPPNAPHANIVDEGARCGWKWLYVDPMLLLPQLPPRVANDINNFQHSITGSNCVLSASEHPEIYALVAMIIAEMEQQRAHYQHISRQLLHALMLQFLRSAPQRTAKVHFANERMGCIAPAIDHIARNYMNDISIEDLSRLCHVSASHFRRLFKQILGWAPLDYVQVIRIDRARVLLYNYEYSVTEIGLMVGYSSPSSFGRQFHRIVGISPSQWRQKMRSEDNPIVTAYFDSIPNQNMSFFPSDEHSSGGYAGSIG